MTKYPARLSLGVYEDRFSAIAITHAANLVIAATNPLDDTHALVAWGYPSGAERWRVPLPSPGTTTARVWSIHVARDDAFFATVQPAGVCAARELATGKEFRGIEADEVVAVAALDRERLLVFVHSASGPRLIVWNARTNGFERAVDGLPARTPGLAASASGALVAVESELVPPQRGLAMLERATFRQLHDFGGARGTLAGFRAGDAEIVVRDPYGSGPVIHDAHSGRVIAALADSSASESYAAAMSPSGRWLATSHGEYVDNHREYPDLCLRIWDLAERRLHRRLEVDARTPPGYLAFADDDTVLAASTSGDITIWSVAIPT